MSGSIKTMVSLHRYCTQSLINTTIEITSPDNVSSRMNRIFLLYNIHFTIKMELVCFPLMQWIAKIFVSYLNIVWGHGGSWNVAQNPSSLCWPEESSTWIRIKISVSVVSARVHLGDGFVLFSLVDFLRLFMGMLCL